MTVFVELTKTQADIRKYIKIEIQLVLHINSTSTLNFQSPNVTFTTSSWRHRFPIFCIRAFSGATMIVLLSAKVLFISSFSLPISDWRFGVLSLFFVVEFVCSFRCFSRVYLYVKSYAFRNFSILLKLWIILILVKCRYFDYKGCWSHLVEIGCWVGCVLSR